jgi:hypothetical protein
MVRERVALRLQKKINPFCHSQTRHSAFLYYNGKQKYRSTAGLSITVELILSTRVPCSSNNLDIHPYRYNNKFANPSTEAVLISDDK